MPEEQAAAGSMPVSPVLEPESEPVPHSEPESEPAAHSEPESEPVPHSEPESEPGNEAHSEPESDPGNETHSEPESASEETPVPPIRPDRGPVLVLAGMVGLYFALYGFLTYRQQSNFATFGFDLGIHDQGIWLLAHGYTPFVTVRGLDYFATFASPIAYLMVPFYWLGAGPHFLLLFNTAMVAAGAIPLWLLARDRLHNEWVALVVPLAYLLYPATNWVTWWNYHPDSLMITPLLFAYWLAVRRKWGWYAVAATVTLLCKQDGALALIFLGLLIYFWLKDNGKDESPESKRLRRRMGLITAVIAAAWFGLWTKYIVPWRNHGEAPFYNSFFPSLGNNIPQILHNALRHPSRVWHLAQLHDRRTYYAQLFAPVAFLPFLALPALLVMAPQFGINITATTVNGATIATEWVSLPIVGVFLATVEGLAFIRRWEPRLLRFAAGVLAATSLASCVAWGLSPISIKFHDGLWEAHNSIAPELHTAISLVPADTGVSVIYNLTPQFTHRVYVYEFPNPWIPTNYGQLPTDHGDPSKVQWLVLIRPELGTSASLFNSLTGAGGAFRIVYDERGVVVARRSGSG